jgi:hypothetical protein
MTGWRKRQVMELALKALETAEIDGNCEYGATEIIRKALTQPERTWVGLTEEEIKAFDTWHDNREEEVGWCNPSEIVAYIEAKLKEKNFD